MMVRPIVVRGAVAGSGRCACRLRCLSMASYSCRGAADGADDALVAAAAAVVVLPPLEDFLVARVGGLRQQRSEERRVGKECVRTGGSRWSTLLSKKKKTTNN